MEEVIGAKVHSTNVLHKAFRHYKQRKNLNNSTKSEDATGSTENNGSVEVEPVGDGPNCEVKPSDEQTEDIELGFDEDELYEDVDKLKLYTKKLVGELNEFYEKFAKHKQKRKNITQLLSDIDAIAGQLKSISKLNQYKSLPASFARKPHIKEKAQKAHDDQMKKLNSPKWWQRIHLLPN